MVLIYIIKPNVIYDTQKKEFRQFGFANGKTLLPIHIIGILLSIIIYLFFYYLSVPSIPLSLPLTQNLPIQTLSQNLPIQTLSHNLPVQSIPLIKNINTPNINTPNINTSNINTPNINTQDVKVIFDTNNNFNAELNNIINEKINYHINKINMDNISNISNISDIQNIRIPNLLNV